MARIDRRVKGKPFQDWLAGDGDVQFVIQFKAAEIEHRAEQLLSQHHVQNVAHIETAYGKKDSYVVLVDSNVTNDESSKSNSALSIEFGREDYVDEWGNRFGGMEGLHILQRAAHLSRTRGKKAAAPRLPKFRPRDEKKTKKKGR